MVHYIIDALKMGPRIREQNRNQCDGPYGINRSTSPSTATIKEHKNRNDFLIFVYRHCHSFSLLNRFVFRFSHRRRTQIGIFFLDFFRVFCAVSHTQTAQCLVYPHYAICYLAKTRRFNGSSVRTRVGRTFLHRRPFCE